MNPRLLFASGWTTSVARWLDGYAAGNSENQPGATGIDWLRAAPFIAMHLGCIAVLWVGWSPVAIAIAAVLYGLRMFAITGFYHRYFSHRAFKTSRAVQLVFALLGASAVQRGPLWWASQHRHHHVHSDGTDDGHSPAQHGFLWSHMGWFLSRAHFNTRHELVRDFRRYPELRFLDRFDVLVPLALALGLFATGESLRVWAPSLGTDGWQLLVWGFFISTVALYHATFTINSLAHRFGTRRFATRDDSRNNPWLALLTFGEGWHNNHHYFPGSARQGFRRWEVDLTYYGLKLLAATGLIWDLRPVPQHVQQQYQPTATRRGAPL